MGKASNTIKLKKRTVEEIEPGAARRIVWDSELPGFGVEVSPKGVRSYRLTYRHNGRSRLLTLGRHGAITAEEARDLAKRALGAVAHGRDPAAEKQAARRTVTLAEAFEDWLDRHCAAKLKPASAVEYRRLYVKNIAPALGSRPVADVTRADVSALHRRLAATPYIANRLVAVMRSFFTHAERQGLRPEGSNPARLVAPYRERRRERVLTADELARLGDALAAAPDGDRWPVAALRLLILTGARRGEILGLRWANIDLEKGTARLGDSKTGPKTLYLPKAARDVLAALPRTAGNPHVIPGAKAGASFVGLGKVWRRIRARAGLDDLRIHDLRHAFASAGAAEGLSLVVLAKLLGHKQTSTSDRYVHMLAAPLVEAADTIAAPIARHMRRT